MLSMNTHSGNCPACGMPFRFHGARADEKEPTCDYCGAIMRWTKAVLPAPPILRPSEFLALLDRHKHESLAEMSNEVFLHYDRAYRKGSA